MAVSSAALVEGSHASPAPGANGGHETTAQQGRVIRFKRNLFTNESSVGRPVTREGPRRGQVEQGATEEFVEFSQPLKEQYRRFLDNHVTNLLKLRDIPDPANARQTMYERILTNPNHAVDRELVRILGTEITDLHSRESEIHLSEEKINSFLERHDGMAITTMLLEQQTAMKMYALGLHAARNPQGDRQAGIADPMMVHLNINRGVANKFYQEKLSPNLRRITNVLLGVDATMVSTLVGYAMRPDAIGAGVGAAVPAAIYGANRAIRSLMKNGVTLDLRQCSGAFQVINSDPIEREYVKAIMGIDTHDFVDRGGNVIAQNTLRIAESTKSPEDLQLEVLGEIAARQEFYGTFIPQDRLDAHPLQFLTRIADFQQERNGVRWQQEIQTEFNPNGGGVVAGDVQGNIRRGMEAQRKVMLRWLTNYSRAQLKREGAGQLSAEEKHERQGVLTILSARREALGNQDELRRTRGAENTRRKERLGTDRTTLQNERTAIESYTNELSTLRQDRVEGERNLRRELDTTLSGVYGNTRDALNGLRSSLTSNIDINIDGLVITSPYEANRLLNAEATRRYAEIADPAFRVAGESLASLEARSRQARSAVDEDITTRKSVVERNANLVKTVISRIEKAQELAQKAPPDTLKDASVRELTQNLSKIQGEFTALTGWETTLTRAGLASPGLTEADLRTQPIDELIRRINAAHVLGLGQTPPLAVGWAENRNNQPEIRMRVQHAKAEALARNAQPQIETPGTEFTTLTGPPHNLSENELRTLPVSEIERRATGVATADIQTAVQVATNRLDARSQAISGVISGIDEQIQQEEAALNAIDFGREVSQIQATEDLLNRYGPINEKAFTIVHEREEFTETRVSTARDTDVTDAERTHPRGYLELMNALFDYKNKPNRVEYFNSVQTLLPPTRLAGILNQELGLGLAGPNMPAVLAEMRTRMDPANGIIGPKEMRDALRGIIRELQNEALAVAP